jgi:hypothetical protein
MVVMAVMHEQMHQGARGEEQPGKHTEYVRCMFCNQKEGSDRQERQQNQVGSAGCKSGPVSSIHPWSPPARLDG